MFSISNIADKPIISFSAVDHHDVYSVAQLMIDDTA